MNRILLIETATDVCSAAIAEGDRIISSGHISEPRSQASGLAPMIQDVLSRAGMHAGELSAVAVSAGPGSYTGLRVGVSTAKGICFGAGIPLIGIGTLTVIAQGVIRTGACTAGEDCAIIPMIDARRMEVYTAVYDSYGHQVTDTSAVVLEPDTFASELQKYGKLIFAGDGAAKYRDMIPEKHIGRCVFVPSHPQAEDMAEAPSRHGGKTGSKTLHTSNRSISRNS